MDFKKDFPELSNLEKIIPIEIATINKSCLCFWI